MDNTKIEIRIGEIQFIGEGDPNWLEKQLDKILNKTELLSKISNAVKNKDNPAIEQTIKGIDSQPLATFLKSKDAMTNQVLKFLATSMWLQLGGKERLKTSDVTTALSKANQKKLNNASDCLGQNITKGHCEREGNEFFVTAEGRAKLGL
jgi:hypothetical protein